MCSNTSYQLKTKTSIVKQYQNGIGSVERLEDP